MQLKTQVRALAFAAAATAALLAGTAVSAHQIWIEQDAGGARLFFGEYGENLREVSPGLLDKFGKPIARKATAQGVGQPAEVTKAAANFSIPFSAAKGESLIAEDATYPMWDLKGPGQTGRGMYLPAARLVTDLSAQKPLLTLDLVPTGTQTAEGATLQAFFEGKPLAKAKVAVVTASGWAQEHHTDAEGKLTVSLPWNGTYVMELSHNGPAGQRADGQKFEKGSYVTSLTLVRDTGLPALPAPPAAAPNK
ncbi:DUF4198 domain-containing protein [Xylophilus sp. GOD-11R]|uniref:DUF4198 domain-containing protein n=1 Tax=Xylophilus sp. GOD-11R TaxID=3089814 RepID=UPI00298D2AC7|nr:DUF4198 domain-containing protein [Xylophilus sp. GOD-11R]WPB56825.1 DUF4198 domain-containing protein [Xylophilus sp. GOD-11R]